MKIGIYHPFGDFPDNYSLSHVAQEQILMVIENGHECYLYVTKWFKWDMPELFKSHPDIGNFHLKNILPSGTSDAIHKALTDDGTIESMNVIMTHDVAYLDSYRAHAEVLRPMAENGLRMLHWAHSAPNPDDPHQAMSNSVYIGVNYMDIKRLAQQFNVGLGKIGVVYNSVSPDVWYDWHPLTKRIVEDHKLLEQDILLVLPFDTGRWEAKGGHHVQMLADMINKENRKCKAVFINAAANEDKRRKLVNKWSKHPHSVFTSTYEGYEVFVPRRVVRELMQLSDVLPLLSRSEGCSLIMLEAGLMGLLLVLNEGFPPLTEFGGIDRVHYMKVPSDRANTEYNPDIKTYFSENANIIINLLGTHGSMMKRYVRKEFNRQWVWTNQLKPLLGVN